jgi:hypothetical protein
MEARESDNVDCNQSSHVSERSVSIQETAMLRVAVDTLACADL